MNRTYYKPVVNWLILGAIMVVAMVVIGGITRLTNSGLSMVDWNLFSGAIPPLNEIEWQTTFDNYKNYPEYQQVNFDMELSEFKAIFFWEWLHRVLGRTIGLVFVIPFAYFLIRKRCSKPLKQRLWILLGLGALQGFLGWFMVLSGLSDRAEVSHFRLAIHLSAAFLTFSFIWWLILGIVQHEHDEDSTVLDSIRKQVRWFVPLVLLQIIYGAFVAGLDAGLVYPTWPKMGEYWIPPQVAMGMEKMGFSGLWNDRVSVQFVHRIIAYLVAIYSVILWMKSTQMPASSKTKRALTILLISVLVQVFLGISTLLMHVPVFMGVLHQLGGLLVLSATVYLLYQVQRKSVSLN